MSLIAPVQNGRVMVCTDSAARGLDIQDVTHVIQADFAPNAVDFIKKSLGAPNETDIDHLKAENEELKK